MRAVHRGPLGGFLITELSAMLALPLGYGIAGGACAPPGIGCFMRDIACAAVCADAWSQFPTVAAYGAAVGLIPAVLAGLLLWRAQPRSGLEPAPWSLIAVPMFGVVGTAALAAIVFPYMGGTMLTAVLGCGLIVAAALGAAYTLSTRAAVRHRAGGPK